jgi:death on curing protein
MAGRKRSEPRWLTRVIVDAIHADQIREHGGLPGVRDEKALESALARPRQKRAYGNERDLLALAAAYGFGFVQYHPYRDGNKRIGFLSIATFLGINDVELDVTDAEVVTTILGLASGKVSEEELAKWIRAHVML